MRPVRRNQLPLGKVYAKYKDSQPDLVSRLGMYCSYCERRIPANLAVEHIQPKALPAYRHLILTWENFLLACVNCNSTKKDKNIALSDVYLPDRDNTFIAFEYFPDGTVTPASNLSAIQKQIAQTSLALTGLNKKSKDFRDENGKLIALERKQQRMEAWGVAEEAYVDVMANPGNQQLRKHVVQNALSEGYFSIWMKVFENDSDMRSRIITAFSNSQSNSGTRASGCFDPVTTLPVSPAPNPDGLADGGKI